VTLRAPAITTQQSTYHIHQI